MCFRFQLHCIKQDIVFVFVFIVFELFGVGLAQWLVSRTTNQGVPGYRQGRGTVCCGLEQVTFTHCLVLVKPRKPWMDD